MFFQINIFSNLHIFFFSIECDQILCAPLIWPENLEIGQQAVISNDSCCPTVQIVCFDKLCPDKPECQDQLELVEEKGECCTTYKCSMYAKYILESDKL